MQISMGGATNIRMPPRSATRFLLLCHSGSSSTSYGKHPLQAPRLVRKWFHSQQSEAVRPKHVHHQQNKDSGRNQRQEQAAALLSKMHEIHDGERPATNRQRKQDRKKRASRKVLVGQKDFHGGNTQQNKIHRQIFGDDVFRGSGRGHGFLSVLHREMFNK